MLREAPEPGKCSKTDIKYPKGTLIDGWPGKEYMATPEEIAAYRISHPSSTASGSASSRTGQQTPPRDQGAASPERLAEITAQLQALIEVILTRGARPPQPIAEAARDQGVHFCRDRELEPLGGGERLVFPPDETIWYLAGHGTPQDDWNDNNLPGWQAWCLDDFDVRFSAYLLCSETGEPFRPQDRQAPGNLYPPLVFTDRSKRSR
jgi:hypothetical protein